jgi:hypothetical protein
MIKIIVAFIAGMFVATVGITGVASAVDKAVGKTQEVMKETVKLAIDQHTKIQSITMTTMRQIGRI